MTLKATDEVQDIKKDLRVFLVMTCAQLVDTPMAVNISSSEDDEKIIFYVRTAEGEEGQLIGTKGTISAAMRTLIKSMAKNFQLEKKVYLEIISTSSEKF